MRTLEIPVVFEVTRVDVGQIAEIFTEELRTAVGDCILHVQERVKMIMEDKDIINEGDLINSIASAMGLGTNPIEGTVGTNKGYAKYVENGTVPHFVPFHMAKSLYNQAKGDWGWVDPPGKSAYEADSKGRVWLCPAPGAKPTWGVFVSGKAQPFMWPGWQQSVEYIEGRLLEACQRAAARVNGGA